MRGTKLVILAFLGIFSHFDVVMKLTLFWGTIACISLTLLGYILVNSYSLGMQVFLYTLFLVCQLLTTTIVSLGWHRFWILGEKPSTLVISSKNWPLLRYCKSMLFGIFAIWLIPLAVVYSIASILWIVVPWIGYNLATFGTLVLFITYVVVAVGISLALSSALVASALDYEIEVERCFDTFLGNISAYFVGGLAILAAIVGIAAIAFKIWIDLDSGTIVLLDLLVAQILYLLFVLFATGVISHLYRQFVRTSGNLS